MKVSVIIPTRGGRHEMLAEAVASVEAQVLKAHEIIIASGSGDLWPRLNESIRKSTGDAFVVLGDDDRLSPLFLKATVNHLRPGRVDIVYTNLVNFGVEGGAALAKEWNKDNIEQDTVAWFTCLISRRIFDVVGGYDEDVGPYADWSMGIKCFRAGARAVHVNAGLFCYRYHEGQESKKIDHLEARRRVVERYGLPR